ALAARRQGFGAAAGAPVARRAFALATLARVALGATAAIRALTLARGPKGRVAWLMLTASGGLLVASSASISQAMARLDHRALLLILDAAHQLAAAIWVGGLIHLLATMSPSPSTPALARRFSTVALGSVVTLV